MIVLRTGSFLILFCLCIALPVFAQRVVTIDDALAIKSVGAVEVSPDTNLVAIEAEGGILVLSSADGKVIKKIEGGGSPTWSPDAKLLAFFAIGPQGKQVQTWNRRTDLIDTITDIPGGVLGNPWFWDFCPSAIISWAPDSKGVVFTTR